MATRPRPSPARSKIVANVVPLATGASAHESVSQVGTSRLPLEVLKNCGLQFNTERDKYHQTLPVHLDWLPRNATEPHCRRTRRMQSILAIAPGVAVASPGLGGGMGGGSGVQLRRGGRQQCRPAPARGLQWRPASAWEAAVTSSPVIITLLHFAGASPAASFHDGIIGSCFSRRNWTNAATLCAPPSSQEADMNTKRVSEGD
ncbi:hypothetical protein ABZP36_023390 [Zizania latifolia]